MIIMSKPTQLRHDHLRMKGEGPRAMGKGVWIMLYTFKCVVYKRH